jgi:hypothetical protein
MRAMRRDVPLRSGWPGAGLALPRDAGVWGETAQVAPKGARGRPGAGRGPRHFPGGRGPQRRPTRSEIGRSGEEAEDIREETGSVAEPIGEFEASFTPRPRFDRKANHRRYMREWRRRRVTLRKSCGRFGRRKAKGSSSCPVGDRDRLYLGCGRMRRVLLCQSGRFRRAAQAVRRIVN